MLRQLRLLVLLAAGGHLAYAANAANKFDCLEQAEANAKAKRSFQKAVIIIGIPNPTLAEGPRPVPSAKDEFDAVQKFFAGKRAFDNHVYTLEGKDATTSAVTQCLELVANNAELKSTVIVFISARGYFIDGMPDGFLLTADGLLDKLPTAAPPDAEKLKKWPGGNGVILSTLMRKVQLLPKSGELYLFLDLCRNPEEKSKVDNKINGRILNNQFYAGAGTQRIIVATTGVQRSLPNVFADSLVTVIPPGQVKFEELFEALKRKVLAVSRNNQTPARPEPPGSNGEGCLLCAPKQTALPGPLLASAVPMASFAEQNVPEVPADVVTRRIEAVRAEEAGQEIFVRYGEGNHFPGDPLAQCENPDPVFLKVKLCAEQFEGAARKFSEAAGKYVIGELGDVEGDRQAVASLEERERFSRAQALLLGKQFKKAEEALASGGVPFAFAESHNLLGISYLEQGEYERAEAEFRAATEKARYWGYPRHNLALALVEHGSYGEAERVYREAIATTPVGEMFHDKLNSCFAKRSVLVGARPYLYYNLGVLLQRLNRLGEARTQFCLAEASFRLSLEILKAQGAVLPTTRAIAAQTNPVDGKKSAEDFEVELATKRAIAALRNLGDVKNSQGVLLQMRGKRKQAETQFTEALEANSGLLAAKYNLGKLKEKKEPAKAKQLYGEILADAACMVPEGKRDKDSEDKRELSCVAAEKAQAKV